MAGQVGGDNWDEDEIRDAIEDLRDDYERVEQEMTRQLQVDPEILQNVFSI